VSEPELVLRQLRPDDEAEALRAHAELAAEGVSFLFEYEAGEPWEALLARIDDLRTGRSVPAGWVRSTFLVADVGGEIVGRLSVRHETNDYIAAVAGHIGYVVRPAYRRRGYATAMLREALYVARELGLGRVLLTTDLDNAASGRVIERCGGVFAGVVEHPESGQAKRHYWIDTAAEARR
jgi:predicted acetyltransferase